MLYPDLPPGVAYDFDCAVQQFGTAITNALQETDEVPYTPPVNQQPTKLVPRYTLAELLAEDESCAGGDLSASDGLAGLDLSAYEIGA